MNGPDEIGMTDAQLPGYMRLHCRTPVGLVHKKHLARLYDLAGLTAEAKQVRDGKEWWRPDPSWIDPLADEAERRMSAIQ